MPLEQCWVKDIAQGPNNCVDLNSGCIWVCTANLVMEKSNVLSPLGNRLPLTEPTDVTQGDQNLMLFIIDHYSRPNVHHCVEF